MYLSKISCIKKREKEREMIECALIALDPKTVGIKVK
jgi:hypothetical protein